MIDLKIGDILGIDLDDGSIEPGVVLYLSKSDPGLMLLGLPLGPLSEPLQDCLKMLIYTDRDLVDKETWSVTGRCSAAGLERISARIDGDEVWLGDKFIRLATPEDRSSIPQLMVSGCGAVRRLALKTKNGNPPKLAQKILRATERLLNELSRDGGLKGVESTQAQGPGTDNSASQGLSGSRDRHRVIFEAGWNEDFSKVFETQENEENGYLWHAIVEAHVRNKPRYQDSRLSFSPEADSLLVTSLSKETLDVLKQELTEVGSSASKISKLLDDCNPDFL